MVVYKMRLKETVGESYPVYIYSKETTPRKQIYLLSTSLDYERAASLSLRSLTKLINFNSSTAEQIIINRFKAQFLDKILQDLRAKADVTTWKIKFHKEYREPTERDKKDQEPLGANRQEDRSQVPMRKHIQTQRNGSLLIITSSISNVSHFFVMWGIDILSHFQTPAQLYNTEKRQTIPQYSKSRTDLSHQTFNLVNYSLSHLGSLQTAPALPAAKAANTQVQVK